MSEVKAVFANKDNNKNTSLTNSQSSNYKNIQNSKKKEWKKEWKNESKIILGLALPVTLTTIARLAVINIDTAFLGHLGTNELAGSSLASVTFQLLTTFVYAPAYSLTSLCSQAIGANNPKLSGNWLQLSLIVVTIVTVLILPLYYNVDFILSLFDHNDKVLHYAGKFGRWYSIVLWPSATFLAIRQFYQSARVILPATIISWSAVLMNLIFNSLFIYGIHYSIFNKSWSGLGFIGSPIASSVSIILQLITYLIIVNCKQYHKLHNIWNGWDLKNSIKISRLKEFFKVVIPLTVGDASANWAYQIVTLMSGKLQSDDVASIAVASNLFGILWGITWGYCLSTIVRTGNNIGKGDIKATKLTGKVSIILITITTIIVSTVLCLFRNLIAHLYSNDKNVINTIKKAIPLLCINFIVSGIGWVCDGILEGLSCNKIRGYVNVSTSWLIYVPLAIYFSYYSSYSKHYSPVCIMWIIAIFYSSINTICMFYLVYKIDWNKQVYLARKRSEALNKLDNHKQSLMEAPSNDTFDDTFDDTSNYITIITEDEIG